MGKYGTPVALDSKNNVCTIHRETAECGCGGDWLWSTSCCLAESRWRNVHMGER
jgi:hypothetical protein